MSKNVQIPYELFELLVRYHLHYDESVSTEIAIGLNEKLEAMKKRELFSKSKTATSEEERKSARAEYDRLYGLPF